MFVVFVGPPGGGKGTQCRRLAELLGVPHISTGEIFREAIKEGTPLGIQAEQFMAGGHLVPDEIVVGLVAERLSQPDCANGWLLDGYPRNRFQAGELDAYLSRKEGRLDRVISLHVPRQEIETRMLSRAVEEGRADDTPEVIRNRMAVYDRVTAPVLEYYEAQNVLHTIDGLGTRDEVFSRIKKVLT